MTARITTTPRAIIMFLFLSGPSNIAIANFPKELPAAELEAAEVVLAVRIVVVGERVERRGLLERRGLHHIRKRIDAAVMTTLPPEELRRNASLRSAILFIVALLGIFALVR